MVFRRYGKKILFAGLATGTVALGSLQFVPKYLEYRKKDIDTGSLTGDEVKRFHCPVPSRLQQLNRMRTEEFDVLIVGGGATGTGVALDSQTRGLNTCLVEKFDFASGTSSRSTKLIHGGVRYLQKAVFNLDKDQFNMVIEALGERANLLRIAPHLTTDIPIMLPIYKWWQIPYYWAGIKLYDLISGYEILKASYYLNKPQALEKFPMLKKTNLKGALIYYDGQQDDARMCLSIAITASRYGAAISNYTEVVRLLKDKKSGKIIGARVKDRLTEEEFDIRAKAVVNATGPFTDSLREMDDKTIPKICQPSSGVHIVLPGYYSPDKMGLLDPNNSDDRVIFFLPWQHSTIAGTTDTACEVTHEPGPSEKEVGFILSEIQRYLSPDIKVRRGDVLSAWSGIRPLVKDPNSKDTQAIARNHIIEVSKNGLVTIAGGKWTTYRSMAAETVDAVLKYLDIPYTPSQTKGLLLEGAHGWHPNFFITLKQEFGMDTEVAKHLSSSYGSKSLKIGKLAELTGLKSPVVGRRLHPEYPFIESEVKWACMEYAVKAVDVIAFRLRLSFLNVYAAQEALPKIIEIMAGYLKWDENTKQKEYNDAMDFLRRQMSLGLKVSVQNIPINFNKEEIDDLMEKFKSIDNGNKGFLTIRDLKKYLQESDGLMSQEHITDLQLMDILNEVDTNKNGEIDPNEFLQFMSALKTGAVAESRFKQLVIHEEPVTIYRSCGGV